MRDERETPHEDRRSSGLGLVDDAALGGELVCNTD